MKVLVESSEKEGLDSLMGKRILLMCAGYFYEGKLVGINDTCVKISDAHIVYETGSFSDSSYKDKQKLHADNWYVQTGLIESFGLSKDD